MSLVTIIALAVLIDALIGVGLGRYRGSPLLGLWLGAVFGPIGWVILWYWTAEDDASIGKVVIDH